MCVLSNNSSSCVCCIFYYDYPARSSCFTAASLTPPDHAATSNSLTPRSLCRELGIGIVAYSPLGRGFLTGEVKSRDDLAADDWRRSNYPPMSEENFPHNLQLVERVKDVAQKRGCTAGQVALAWVHAQGEDVFPIPGTKRIKYAEQNHAAFDINLTPEDLEELNFEVKGNRFNNMDISL